MWQYAACGILPRWGYAVGYTYSAPFGARKCDFLLNHAEKCDIFLSFCCPSNISKGKRRNLRGTAYGILNIWFGTFWFLGSALMGFLYDISIISLVIFSLGIQLASIPILIIIKRDY